MLTILRACAPVLCALTLTAPAAAQTPTVTGGAAAGDPTAAEAGPIPQPSGGASFGDRADIAAAETPAADGSSVKPGTVAAYDAATVKQLGLASVAAHVQRAAEQAALQPPAYFGTEVVARYLGLRRNLPAGSDAREVAATDKITAAEVAHTRAAAAALTDHELGAARRELGFMRLPRTGGQTLQTLRVAVSKIGMPYVWGGEADTARGGKYGPQAAGGYDCSGFLWRVFKLSGLPAGERITGRTAAQMASEAARSDRVGLRGVWPGDLLFFGTAGPRSAATESSITHAGLALSADWAIHSSRQGVYVSSLTSGWLHDTFSWGRRILR